MSLLEISFFILLFLVMGCVKSSKNTKKECFLYLAFAFLLFIRSFVEYESLPDLPGYLNAFDDLKGLNVFSHSDMFTFQLQYKEEFGYILLSKICGVLFGDFRIFLMSFSFLLLLFYFKIIYTYSSNVYLSVLLFFLIIFPQSLFVLRQHLAVAIILLTFPLIIEQKFKYYLVVCFIAFLFHKSAVIFMPVYFLYQVANPKKICILFLGTSLLLVVLFGHIGVVNEVFSLGFGSYIDGDKSGNSNLTGFFINVCFFLVYVFTLKKRIFEDGLLRLLTVLISLDVILSLVGLQISLLSRMGLYFHISIIFIVPLVFNRMTKITKVAFSSTVFALLFIVSFYGSSANYSNKMSVVNPLLQELPFFLVYMFLFSVIVLKCKFKLK